MTVVSYFIEALTQYPFTPENEAIMKALSDLYALHGIVENAAEFMNVSVCVRVYMPSCMRVHAMVCHTHRHQTMYIFVLCMLCIWGY